MFSVVDEISQCIELLQPEKLKQIFSHHLVLKNVDKQKYLDQINNKIEQLKIAREKSEIIDPIRIKQTKYGKLRNLKVIAGSFGVCVGLISLIALLRDNVPYPGFTAFIGMQTASFAIGTGIGHLMVGSAEGRKIGMLEKHFNSVFKKAYFVKALLEEVVAV